VIHIFVAALYIAALAELLGAATCALRALKAGPSKMPYGSSKAKKWHESQGTERGNLHLEREDSSRDHKRPIAPY
jgi:hypothetical protein